MIKGIYNENEFYTNFYWDSKFIEDLRTKIGADSSTQAAISVLKSLDGQFWALKEIPEGDPKRLDAQVGFYNSLFMALGYRPEAKLRQMSSGQSYSLLVEEKSGGQLGLFAVLIDQTEAGAFEASPVCLESKLGLDAEAVVCELSEVLQEELLESQSPPRWILVGAPNALFIVERSKWAFGRYLRVEWQEVFLQRDTKPYEFVFGIAAKRVLCPDTGNSPHDEFDDNSHRHAFEVTTELRESVRESVEILINEMIDLKKEGHQKIYSADKADQYAKELTHDALYYVYRLLFLLYLEAQGDDSDLLPLKSEIYRNGYSLEKLLELDFTEIAPHSAESNGTFLFESLDQIHNLIFFGFEPGATDGFFQRSESQSGFLVKGIKSDLFDPTAIKHLGGVKLRNGVLLEILKKLSLTRKREKGARPRARVSYANLGINQLGAVYESLLSYTGFFAEEELHSLKPSSIKQGEIDSGKELDQVFLAPKSLVDRYRKASEKKYRLSDENVVSDESGNPKIYKKGSFIYRLAGRDRQKLASYYTPESLTKCTVKYSLKVLFESKRTLEDLWGIRILEPAMGSGAFLNEAVNQLADRILELEVLGGGGDLRTPKAKQKRIWDIKYQLIANNVYGVDLNPTAIELARFSLWLNCIGAGKAPPTFKSKFKVGNSLIGARLKKGADGIFPWLVLDDGMANYGKRLSDYDSVLFTKAKAFRADFLASRLAINDPLIQKSQAIAESLIAEFRAKGNESNNSLYDPLKFCADLWCSFFFLDDEAFEVVPNTHTAFLNAIISVLERGIGALPESLRIQVQRIAERERFFHWEIEFPEIVFGGGFDLILGNPPWVPVEWQDSIFVSDYNIIPSVAELNAAGTREFIDNLADEKINRELARQFLRVEGYSNLLETDFYRSLKGLSKNTYKAFDVLGLALMEPRGAFGIIQEDGILEDKDGSEIREELYRRFRYHFQFQNEKFLFAEVGHAKRFSVNIFSQSRPAPHFEHIGNLFLPQTIDQCLDDKFGTEPLPLIKDEQGNWETRGHQARVIKIEQQTLNIFARFLNESNKNSPRFLNLHSSALFAVVGKVAACGDTFESWAGGSSSCVGSQMLNETTDQGNGNMAKKSARPRSIGSVILSGPHINTGNPLSQETQIEFKSKFSYDVIDLERIPDDFVQRTIFQLEISEKDLDGLFSPLAGRPYRSYFRLISRGMINPTNERCLFTSIIPPGVNHTNGLRSLAIEDERLVLPMAGLASSLLFDGLLRILNKTNFFAEDFKTFPSPIEKAFLDSIGRRALALNGLTSFYDRLWKIAPYGKTKDQLLSGRALAGFGEQYSRNNALRDQESRRQALIEIEALTALSFGLDELEMLQVYETLFPVLNMYDREQQFDRKDKMKAAYSHFKTRGW